MILYHFLHKKAPLFPVLSLMTPENCIAFRSFKTGFTVNYRAKTMSSKRCKVFSLYGQNFRYFLICSKTVLPIILVRNQIRVTLGGEIGKITFGRIKNKFRTSSNKNSSWCTVCWYIGRVRTARLLLLCLC